MSWSPSYCEAEGTATDRLQCASGRPYAFIVHGLWPQYARGWPEFCPLTPARAPEVLVRSMLDLMPSEALIRHQWAKHGTCSGLTPESYFELTRRARERVRIPERFVASSRPLSVAPEDIERAFLDANPGLRPDGVAVTCDRRRLREVRICLERSVLEFRPCPPVAARSCRLDEIRVPPARGG